MGCRLAPGGRAARGAGGAAGLHAARRELRKIEGVSLDVIAPDSNRSATARSITTRSPLSVQEVRFEDGDLGHATDGTPVDCVRFAEVGLLGHRPDLIVAGINHGNNLGDDVTYSGTVAAAMEGIVLGVPAVAASQQPSDGRGDFETRSYDFEVGARFLADLVRQVIQDPMPERTLINLNFPAGDPEGVDVTRLGKRLYRDELKKVKEDEANGRRHYRIYGYEPGMDDDPDTDIGAIARRRIAVTPLHLNLTHHEGMEALAQRDLDRALKDAVTKA